MTDEIPGHQDDDERRGDGQVGDHQATGLAGQGDDRRDGGQVVAGDDGIGGVQREVGARRPIAAPIVAEAIAGASLTPSPTGITLAPLGFEFLHGVNFVLREQPGADIGDALVSRDCGGDPPVVAGEQFF